MKTIDKIVAPVLLLGSLSMFAGCGAVPKWAQSGDYRDKKEMEMFKEKQIYLELQKLNYQNGDVWTSKSGIAYNNNGLWISRDKYEGKVVYTRESEDCWTFRPGKWRAYILNDADILKLVKETGTPIDKINRK